MLTDENGEPIAQESGWMGSSGIGVVDGYPENVTGGAVIEHNIDATTGTTPRVTEADHSRRP